MLEIIKKVSFYLPSVCSYQKVCIHWFVFLLFPAMVLQLSMNIPPNEIRIVYMPLLCILVKASVRLLFYIVPYKICIVITFVRHMESHLTSIIFTVLHLIFMFL